MNRWILIGIFLLGFTLRLVNIGNLPKGFTPDEASFGYDAYSLLETGQDQWGKPWPLVFKSFGDYKLPLYTYLAMPSVGLFGLNEFSVRLPNALLGGFAVIVTYLLARELLLSISAKQKSAMGSAEWVPILSATFLAMSPWHIQLSRGAFEANLTTFFLTAGVYFFFIARKNDLFLSVSMLFFGLNLFTYHSARIVTPLILVSLLWLFRKDFPRTKKYTVASIVFLGFFIVAVMTLFQGGAVRASTSTIFSQNFGSGVLRAMIVNTGTPEIIGRLFFNEPLFKIAKLTHNYISYLSPTFLLTDGANETTYGMIPGMGLISLIEFVGILGFVIYAVKHASKEGNFLIFWILVAVLPASISIGPGNAANRAAILMPAIQMIAAIGILYFCSLISAIKYVPIIVLCAVFIGLVSFARYAYEQPVIAGNGMMSGMDELFTFLNEYPDKKIRLSRALSEPHIYAAFYEPQRDSSEYPNHITPSVYQNAANSWRFDEKDVAWVDQMEGYSVGRYTVSSIDKIRDFMEDDTYIVGKPEDMPSNARIVKKVLSPSFDPLWVVAEKP